MENRGFPGGSDGKEYACNEGDPSLTPGLRRSLGLGNGNPLQCSCLENPRNGEAWWAAVSGVAQSRTRPKRLSSSSSSSGFYLSLDKSIANGTSASLPTTPLCTYCLFTTFPEMTSPHHPTWAPALGAPSSSPYHTILNTNVVLTLSEK